MNRIKGADSAVADAVEAIPWLRNLMEQTNNRFSQRGGNNRYTMAVAPMNAPTIVKHTISQFDMRLLKATLIHSSRLITDLSIMVRVSKITLFLTVHCSGVMVVVILVSVVVVLSKAIKNTFDARS